MKSKRTKALEIPTQVKLKVYERDNHSCINCGKWVTESNASAHFIGRAQGGLGIEENVLTLCNDCHRYYDNGSEYNENVREKLKEKFRRYLKSKYQDWDETKLIYNKWN